MRRRFGVLLALAATVGMVASLRAAEVVRLLPAYSDRAAWAAITEARGTDPRAVAARAETFLGRTIPPFPRERYLDFRRKGERWAFEAANNARWARLFAFAYGELTEAKGRFLPALAETLDDLCAQPTWVLSAHDRDLANLEGRAVSIDLASAHRAWQVAELVAAFGEALPEATRTRAVAAVRARVVDPYLAMARAGKGPWWATSENNWNPVCHAGAVGATLALPGTTAAERDAAIAFAKRCQPRYLRGFSDEGWTPEGIAYWNYGFGNFAALAEIVRRATDGREDWLTWPEARAPALLTPRLRLDGDVFPTLSDTAADMAPDPFVAFFVATRLGEGGVPPPPRDGALPFPHAFLLTPSAAASAAAGASLPPTVWLPKAQLLIGRAPAMAFFAAGGHNGVSHNHNDLGVFGVAVGGVSVLADLGGESYSARTFSSKRYDSPLLNSWGHAVPRPAETLQAAGKAAAAKTRAFEEEAGGGRVRWVLDLTAAYPKAGLRSLTREFVWEPARPALTVTDRYAFAEGARPFESALVGWGTFVREGDEAVRAEFRGRALRAEVRASDAWALRVEPIPGEKTIERPCAWMDWTLPEDGIPANAPGKAFAPLTPSRAAIALPPATSGFVSVTLTPATTCVQGNAVGGGDG